MIANEKLQRELIAAGQMAEANRFQRDWSIRQAWSDKCNSSVVSLSDLKGDADGFSFTILKIEPYIKS